MKKLYVTDTHLGIYNDSDLWLDIVLSFFKFIVKYCIKNDIKQLYHLGDFFDNRKSLNTKTQHIAHRIAKILALKKDLEVYIVVGNHDCYYKNKIHPNTLELFEEYDHIHIIDEITQIDDSLYVPWGQVPEGQYDAKYCFGHFAINGFHMNDSTRCKGGLDVLKFKDFEKVASGHFHTPSSNKNVIYLGAPYGQDFHDVDGIRGFHVFEDGRFDFIEYEDAPTFKRIYTTEEPLNPDDIKGNIIRVVFTKDFGTTQNQDIIDNILKCEPLLYSIDLSNIKSDDEEESDVSVDMESKEKIVDLFIDKQTFPANINILTLKSMFKKLLKEAGDSKLVKSVNGTMIECNSVGFQNFLSFGSRWQDIELHNGINFVTGVDKDKGKSNGAGKSSFLETIPFALFGKTARDIKQDQIVNWKNKKNCKVVFRFNINNDLYEVERSLKPNKLIIYKNGEPIDQDAHKGDYQAMFEEIFGMDIKMFMNLIHSNVNNSSSILSMKKPEKRTFLEKMFGLGIYSDMNKLANDKLRSIDQKKYKFETDINGCDNRIQTAEGLKQKFALEIRSKKSSIEDIEEIKERLEKIKEDNPNIEIDIEQSEKIIEELKDEINKLSVNHQKELAVLNTRLDSIGKQISNIDSQEEQRKKNNDLNEKIKVIVEKYGDFRTITKIVEDISLQKEEERKKLSEYMAKGLEVHKELSELKVELANVQKKLDFLSDGKCPTCGQDVDNPVAEYKNEGDSIKRKITYREKKIAEFDEITSVAQENDSQFRNKINTLNKMKDKLVELESQIKDVGSEEDREELSISARVITQEIVDKKEVYRKENDSLTANLRSLKNKHTDLMEIKNKIYNIQKEYDIALSKAEEVKKTIDSLHVMMKEQDEAIEVAKNDQKQFNIGIVKLNDLSDYLNSVKFILKDENIKQFTIKQIMPFLNKQTNHYLSEVNYGFYVAIDKWLDVEIKGPGIRNATYESLSGGERRGIDLSLQLALLDIARIQAGIFPDVLVFDELLDSSIDGIGIDQIMKIIKAKNNEFGGKIFIISHRSEIDAELIDNQYQVVKEGGYSKVYDMS